MKKFLSFSFAISALCTATLMISSDPSAIAQKRRGRKEILDGSAVNIGQKKRSVPMESRQGDMGLDGFKPAKTVYLYPRGQRDLSQGIVEKGKTVTLGPVESNGITDPENGGNGGLWNVSDSARMEIYMPQNPNGQLVVVCPGGGYSGLSTWNEGTYVAKWLNDRGIMSVVAKYRLPNGHRRVPLIDIQNVMRYCRHHAEDWGVRQIGIIGFSAGGHLASTAATMYVDSITRPDFAILLYPVITMEDGITHEGTKSCLIGKDADANLVEMYSTNNDVTPDTPPTFIAVSTDDSMVPVENSLRFYESLVRNRVPVEMHVYPYGEHGFGFTEYSIGLDPAKYKDNLKACRPEYSEALERWLCQQAGKAGLDAKEFPAPDWSVDAKPAKTVLLYPEGQGSDNGIEKGPGDSNGIREAEFIKDNFTLYNTGDSARFDLYLAKNPNGKMVVICPGGGYACTAIYHEGSYVAQWLNSQGVSAAVVKYRMPNGHWTVPLTDVQNVFRYCRHHASEWGVTKIGVMGFSAGGHLAASASTLYVDAETKPDFSILVYPVISSNPGFAHMGSFENLIGPRSKWMERKGKDFDEWHADKMEYAELAERYSLEKQVNGDTPVTYIVCSSDDYGVPTENEICYYRALVASGVSCEIHSYPLGGHGWGFWPGSHADDPLKSCRSSFFKSLERFLQEL